MTSKEVLTDISNLFPDAILSLGARECLKRNDEEMAIEHLHELYGELVKHPDGMYRSYGTEICHKIFLFIHRN